MIVYLAACDPKRLKHLYPRCKIDHLLFTHYDETQRTKSLPYMGQRKDERPDTEQPDKLAPARQRPKRLKGAKKVAR